MILVDVFVPAVDKVYNFRLNEDVKVSLIIDEIVEMIGQKEKAELNGEQAELNLYVSGEGRILSKEFSLTESYVTSGKQLILI